jgi:hypothetical protein
LILLTPFPRQVNHPHQTRKTPEKILFIKKGVDYSPMAERL